MNAKSILKTLFIFFSLQTVPGGSGCGPLAMKQFRAQNSLNREVYRYVCKQGNKLIHRYCIRTCMCVL